jgi:predicted patatin/cPLA2 family phospholipase
MATVRDILRGRIARRTAGPPFQDDARLALAIEGGAMRGVVSAGMVSALEELGLTAAFDAVYGSSAGALNGAYFLAGQARMGTSIYYEDINNRSFIDFSRPLRGRPIVDLGYLINDVAQRRKPLDADALVRRRLPLAVLATDVATAERVAFREFSDRATLMSALRAGATMPVVAGPPVDVGGRPSLDASLSEPIPVPLAEAEGATHILVLLTRPSSVPPRLSALDKWFVLPRLQRLSPELAARYRDRAGPYKALLGHIDAERGPAGRAKVMAVRPSGPEVSKLERNAERLKDAAARGFQALMDAVAPR